MTLSEALTLLQEGITAAKGGQKTEARELFMRVIELDDRNESAWLWLSSVVDEIDDQIVCLENVLTINPKNSAAERGLRQLGAKAPSIPPESEPSNLPAERDADLDADRAADRAVDAEPPPAEGRSTICLHCGTANPAWRDLCSLCGKRVDGSPKPVVAEAGQAPPSTAPEEVQLAPDYDTQQGGLITLIAAWIAALAFNKRGAYEYEIFSASTGRTITGVIIGGVAIPLLVILLTGLLFATANLDDMLALVTSVVTSITMLFIGGIAAALLLLLNFYLWTSVLYLVAWLLGGKASFTVHAQLLSIAYSAATLLSLTLMMIGGALLAILSEGPSPLGELIGPIGIIFLSLTSGVYSLAIHGQALSVAHRFSWRGGVGITTLSVLLYGLLVAILLLGGLAASGISTADLQTLLTPTP